MTSNLAAFAPSPSLEERPEERLRGGGWLRKLERPFHRLDGLVGRAVPEDLNPLARTGAVATTCLAVATITGILLLFWYSPSVHQAHASVEAMSESPWTAGLVRSLHRYSSDGAMFFILVHALRMLLARRVAGARWLAWVTGMGLLAITWIDGWLGYWLVWDERARQVALGSTRPLDVVPIFADPPSRSFLTDSGVNSLLFFIVFFLHVLIPLALAMGLWLHLARVPRPRLLTKTPLTLWVTGSLVVLSIVMPATSAAPARMTAPPEGFTMDWWYLAPLALSDRLGPGALWSILLVGGSLATGLPWLLSRRRAVPAEVTPESCNACRKCVTDCPYDAIRMAPRTDGRRFPAQAEVQPDKCVGCGICSGSCDTSGIGLPWMPQQDARKTIDGWLEAARETGGEASILFACREGAGRSLAVDARTGSCRDLPRHRVLQVPCAGWIHPLTVERALRRGARTVSIAACGPGDCSFREGPEWTRQRIEGEREPSLRADRVDASRIRIERLPAGARAELIRRAEAFHDGAGDGTASGGDAGSEAERDGRRRGGSIRRLAASLLLAATLTAIVGWASDAPYALPSRDGAELVVSFRHPGQVAEDCRDLTPEELAALPVHMRTEQVCERRRAPVRLRVTVDGEVVSRSVHEPGGLWGDGSSTAVERIRLPEGEHDVEVALGDTLDEDEWTHETRRRITLTGDRIPVVLFERGSGFTWH